MVETWKEHLLGKQQQRRGGGDGDQRAHDPQQGVTHQDRQDRHDGHQGRYLDRAAVGQRQSHPTRRTVSRLNPHLCDCADLTEAKRLPAATLMPRSRSAASPQRVVRGPGYADRFFSPRFLRQRTRTRRPSRSLGPPPLLARYGGAGIDYPDPYPAYPVSHHHQTSLTVSSPSPMNPKPHWPLRSTTSDSGREIHHGGLPYRPHLSYAAHEALYQASKLIDRIAELLKIQASGTWGPSRASAQIDTAASPLDASRGALASQPLAECS